MTERLRVRVHPGARRERVGRRMADGSWRIEVTAPPDGGKANDAVVELLARVLELKRSAVRVVTGRTSRQKVVEIDECDAADIEARLERAGEP